MLATNYPLSLSFVKKSDRLLFKGLRVDIMFSSFRIDFFMDDLVDRFLCLCFCNNILFSLAFASDFFHYSLRALLQTNLASKLLFNSVCESEKLRAKRRVKRAITATKAPSLFYYRWYTEKCSEGARFAYYESKKIFCTLASRDLSCSLEGNQVTFNCVLKFFCQ